MKTPHLFLNGLLSSALLLTSCHFDFKDIDTSAISAEQTSTMDVDIRVKGRMVSSPSEATADEMAVSLFDIFIFRVSAEGHDLEYASTNNIPEFDNAVEGTSDRHIASLKVTLPSSGPKRVLVVANAQDNNLEYPEATTYDSFTSGIKFNFANGKTPGTPFLMTGQTLVASSTDARLFVTLGREAARMDVSSGNPGIVINRIGFGNAPRECWPFINNFAMQRPALVDYPLSSGDRATAYFLYTPSAESKEDDFRLSVSVQGTWNGEAFDRTFHCPSPLYADYRYDFRIKEVDGALAAVCTPNWSSGSFTVSGVRLRENTFTFPFKADRNWGYELDWSTNLTGDVEIRRGGDESWYSAGVDGDLVRVKCLEDNLSGHPRTASFTISMGRYSHEITVIQQTIPTAAVKFNGWEWMDRNLGATLPLTEENILNSDTYGYYYQWGRNVPFPTFGTVATVPANPTRTSSEAEAMGEFILGDSGLGYDWLTFPPVPADRKTTWKDRTGGTDPCPEGWHVPSYMEYQTILPYTNAAGIGNFTNNVAVLKNGEIFNGKDYNALYVTSGYEEATIYVIKRYKTDQAYYLRLCRAVSGGTPYLRIDTVKGDGNSDFDGASNPDALDHAAVLASAKSFWNNVPQSSVETLFFPACGRRARNTGEVTNQGNNFLTWSATTWDASSSSPYFDALGSNNRIYNMANSRAHAQTVRCLRNYE